MVTRHDLRCIHKTIREIYNRTISDPQMNQRYIKLCFKNVLEIKQNYVVYIIVNIAL